MVVFISFGVTISLFARALTSWACDWKCESYFGCLFWILNMPASHNVLISLWKLLYYKLSMFLSMCMTSLAGSSNLSPWALRWSFLMLDIWWSAARYKTELLFYFSSGGGDPWRPKCHSPFQFCRDDKYHCYPHYNSSWNPVHKPPACGCGPSDSSWTPATAGQLNSHRDVWHCQWFRHAAQPPKWHSDPAAARGSQSSVCGPFYKPDHLGELHCSSREPDNRTASSDVEVSASDWCLAAPGTANATAVRTATGSNRATTTDV